MPPVRPSSAELVEKEEKSAGSALPPAPVLFSSLSPQLIGAAGLSWCGKSYVRNHRTTVGTWVEYHRLQLNPGKTECLWNYNGDRTQGEREALTWPPLYIDSFLKQQYSADQRCSSENWQIPPLTGPAPTYSLPPKSQLIGWILQYPPPVMPTKPCHTHQAMPHPPSHAQRTGSKKILNPITAADSFPIHHLGLQPHSSWKEGRKEGRGSKEAEREGERMEGREKGREGERKEIGEGEWKEWMEGEKKGGREKKEGREGGR
ncbi:hypothetical protein L345_13280, partial [Ophiophagus hannah]